jgi:release factor glutamine methyltransferase
MLERRARREPLAYITGRTEFFGIAIDITPGVLVPRPETEILVEQTLARLKRRAPIIADIGVGTGAIAIALATNLPDATIYATDLSRIALKVARANVKKHHLSRRVMVLKGDLLEPMADQHIRSDAIVSNPPYIPSGDIPSLQPEVSRHEPTQALDGGPDGLRAYRRLLPEARALLSESGFVAVEVGAGQASAVREIAEAAGYSRIEIVRDLAGIERVVIASL